MSANLLTFYGQRRIGFIILIALFIGSILLLPSIGKESPVFEAQAQEAQTKTTPTPCPKITPWPTPVRLPRPDHIVVVIEENKAYGDVMGSPYAPYLNSLAARGASLTQFFAFRHPSQPNYLEFFSGSNQGVIGDCCPLELCQPQQDCKTWTKCESPPSPGAVFPGPSLAGRLFDKGFTFIGYAEDLPDDPRACCDSKEYARKHCPWLDFQDVPATTANGSSTTVNFDPAFWKNKANFRNLPTLSFVIPNLINDMHSPPSIAPRKIFAEQFPEKPTKKGEKSRSQALGELVRQGDVWFRKNLDEYVKWALDPRNNSLLIITWDEDSFGAYCTAPCPTTPPANRIPTLIVGGMVKPDYQSAVQYTHYSLLRTIQEMYGVEWCRLIGGSQRAIPIADIWR